MSQANNIQWIISNEDLSTLHYELSCQLDQPQSSTIALSSKGEFGLSAVELISSLALLETSFSVAFSTDNIVGNSRKVFHLDQVPEDILKKLAGADIFEEKPALGLYNPITKQALILEAGPFNYGFMNAIVLGFLSKPIAGMTTEQYAHAACIDVNGHGLLIVGDHKAGKSTLVSKLLSEAEAGPHIDLGLVSDDWVLLERKAAHTIAHRVSGEYRIDTSTANNPELALSPTFSKLMQSDNKHPTYKVSVPIGQLCSSMGLRSLSQCSQEVILILDPQQTNYWQPTDPAFALSILKASSANVPPLDYAEQESHDSFWTNQLKNYPSITINNRHPEKSITDVAKDIINLALKL